MAQDNSTKVALGIIVLLAIVGVVFLLRGGEYKFAQRESPGQYGWTGECCTCSRALLNVKGAVVPSTNEVLFRNEHVADCSAACAEAHQYTKAARAQYQVTSFVSNDAECRTSLPSPRTYAGAGGFQDQPTSDAYYVAG
jgi:hypothetical protein